MKRKLSQEEDEKKDSAVVLEEGKVKEGGSLHRNMLMTKINYWVDDYFVAKNFFVNQLSFLCINDFTYSEKGRWVVVGPKGDKACLTFSLAESKQKKELVGSQTGDHVFCVIETNQIEYYYNKMKQNGVKIKAEGIVTEFWGKSFVFEDVFGNLWSVVETVDKKHFFKVEGDQQKKEDNVKQNLKNEEKRKNSQDQQEGEKSVEQVVVVDDGEKGNDKPIKEGAEDEETAQRGEDIKEGDDEKKQKDSEKGAVQGCNTPPEKNAEPIMKLTLLTLLVHDLEETKNWYTQKLGFHLIADDSYGNLRWLEISPSADPQFPLLTVIQADNAIKKERVGTQSFLLNVDDVIIFHRYASQNGVIFTGEPKEGFGGIDAQFLDLYNNSWNVRQTIKKPKEF